LAIPSAATTTSVASNSKLCPRILPTTQEATVTRNEKKNIAEENKQNIQLKTDLCVQHFIIPFGENRPVENVDHRELK